MITTRQMKNFDEELFLSNLTSVDLQAIVNDSGSLGVLLVYGLILFLGSLTDMHPSGKESL